MNDPDLLLVKLRWEQTRLLKSIETFEAFVAAAQPGPYEKLQELRWAWVRDMLLHFAHLDQRALQPLMGDARDRAATLAARSAHDLVNVYRQFQRHAQEWHGPVPAGRWCIYRDAMALLIRRIRIRLIAQENEIYPLLPARPGPRRIAAPIARVDFAGEVIKIRSLVYAHRNAAAERLAG